MATQIFADETNKFNGTASNDEFANSTEASETFSMNTGSNTINFDITNNKKVGTDTIELTSGENLTLNFKGSSWDSNYYIQHERVANNDGSVDMLIKTYGNYTWGYAKVVTNVSDEISYTNDEGVDYYKYRYTYYLYDYEINDWAENKVVISDYNATSNRTYTNTSYGTCYVYTNGDFNSIYNNHYSNDRHADYADQNGTLTDNRDERNPINIITIKDIGKENSANSIKLQYQYTYEYINDDDEKEVYSEDPVTVVEDLMSETYLVGKSYGIETEDQVLQGSFLDETFKTGYGDDTVNTVGGTNTVTLYNGGNDVITLGAGADTVDAEYNTTDYYEQDMDTNTVAEGGVLIKNGNSADKLLIQETTSESQLNFYKDGDNLVIIQNWQYSGNRLSKITVEDYMSAESKIQIQGGYLYQDGDYIYQSPHEYTLVDENTLKATYIYDNEEKTYNITLKNIIQSSGEVNGTNNSEALVATAQSTVKTGAGDDIIYTSSANDVITINGSGDKTIVLDTNSGEDTIDIQNHDGKVYLNSLNTTGHYYHKNKSADNNDLIIERYKKYYDSDKNMYVIEKGSKTVIKDYFTFTAENKNKIYINGKVLAVDTLNITGDESETNTISGTDLNDIITGKELVDTINTGKGNDIIAGGKGNDIINIDDTGIKTIRVASGDGVDTVNLSGNALEKYNSWDTSYLRLSHTDKYTGASYQIDGDDLLIYETKVDGDDISTEGVRITGITGITEENPLNAENIAQYNGPLNISGKIQYYENHVEYSNWYNEYQEQENSVESFTKNTMYLTQGKTDEANNINASHENNLVTGGSEADTIVATGGLNHVYTGAGNDNITVNSTNNAVIYAGSGDDTITVNSGTADIYFGTGTDTAYIKGGTGGVLNFVAGEGNKTVIFDGAKDAKYAFNFTGYKIIYDNKYYKRGNDLIIEAIYKTNSEKKDIHTLKNFFSPTDSKADNNTFTNLDITGLYQPTYTWSLNSNKMTIEGIYDSKQKATIFEGTDCSDTMTGTDGVDIVTTTGKGSDEFNLGKGDDIITIDGSGYKNIYYSKGDGNDTVIISDKITQLNDSLKFYIKDSITPDKFAYEIKDGDLIVYRIYNDNGNTVTDSVRITGIKSKTETPVEVTAENIADYSGGLNISGNLYFQGFGDFSTSMPLATKGVDNEANTITTTENKNNTVIGGSKADTITLTGSNDNVYSGAGDDKITTSASTSTIFAGEGNDDITVTSGTTSIYTGAGNDTIHIKGGQGTIYLTAGSGKNTLIFENPNIAGVYNISSGENSKYLDYEKLGKDLVIYRDSSKTDTLTIKGLFGDNAISDGSYLKINNNSLSTINVAGSYNKKKKTTTYEGSGYSDRIQGTKGKDIITTGNGNDQITPGKGNDTITVDGTGTKYIYQNKGDGTDTVILGDTIGTLYFTNNSSSPSVRSYQIEKNGDLTLYRTYVDGDKISNEAAKITGIKALDTTNPAEVNYTNISSSGAGLNITGKISNWSNYKLLHQGKSNKANKLESTAGINNTVTGGSKKDTVVLNGKSDYAYTGAGNDDITVNTTGYTYIYAGSGNDTLTLKATNDDYVIIRTEKGNDTMNAIGSGKYRMYSYMGDGNDTINIGDKFNGSIYIYDEYTNNTSHQVDENGNLILYRTYIDKDKFTTESTKITGIKALNATNPAEVTYSNAFSSSGGLNISGKLSAEEDYSKTLVLGNSKKANNLESNTGISNLILGGSKKDKVTLKGSTDYVYTGAGNDEITVSSTSQAHVYAGSGNDKITINGGSGTTTVHFTAGQGNKIIVFNGTDFDSCNLNFESGYYSYSNFVKSGDDLLVVCKYKNAKNKLLTETHTIKDYFQNADALEDKVKIYGSSLKEYYLYNSSYDGVNVTGEYSKENKATIFEGTKYIDVINGTSKKDIIRTGDYFDTITPGKGDDIVEIDGLGDVDYEYGEVSKTVYINHGDGNDTIRWVDGAAGVARLMFNSNDIISSEKSGTDLVITRFYGTSKGVTSEKTTIEGYYDADGNVVEEVANKLYIKDSLFDPAKTYNKVDNTTNTISITKNYEFATGTKAADTITTTAANSAVYAGNGDDTINVNTGNAIVGGGYGNDTINLNTTGNVAVNHSAGEGNDTIVFGDNTPSALRINVESPMFDKHNYNIDEYMYMSGKHGIHKSGNDLIYSIPTSSAFNTKTETITFENYFADGVNKPDHISLSLAEDDYYYNKYSIESFKYNGIWVDGVTENGVTTYTALSDFYNRYEYNGKGKTVINGGDEEDFYLVSINSKSNLYINDAGGSSYTYDYMYINSDYKNLRALFNVNANGRITLTDNEFSDNFMIFDKGSFKAANIKNILSGKDGKGVVNIDKVFTNSSYHSPNGTGKMEYMYAAKNILKECYNNSSFEYDNKNVQKLIVSYWVEDLGHDVANWLSTYSGGKYADKTAFDVFESDDTKAINALLKVYNVAYDKNFSS